MICNDVMYMNFNKYEGVNKRVRDKEKGREWENKGSQPIERSRPGVWRRRRRAGVKFHHGSRRRVWCCIGGTHVSSMFWCLYFAREKTKPGPTSWSYKKKKKKENLLVWYWCACFNRREKSTAMKYFFFSIFYNFFSLWTNLRHFAY